MAGIFQRSSYWIFDIMQVIQRSLEIALKRLNQTAVRGSR